MKRVLVPLLTALPLVAAVATASAAPAADRLEQIMGRHLYERTGMWRLDDSEREALVEWLQAHTDSASAGEPPVAAAAADEPAQGAPGAAASGASGMATADAGDDRAADSDESAPKERHWLSFLNRDKGKSSKEDVAFRTKIDGHFGGWRGHTRFLFQNGQVWEQRGGEVFLADLDSPEVIIRRNMMGYFEMEIPALERTILVKEIR